MGSEAGYSLKARDAPRAVVGRGTVHMEANYGESFPTGWIWAQVCACVVAGHVFRAVGAGRSFSCAMLFCLCSLERRERVFIDGRGVSAVVLCRCSPNLSG